MTVMTESKIREAALQNFRMNVWSKKILILDDPRLPQDEYDGPKVVLSSRCLAGAEALLLQLCNLKNTLNYLN